MACHEVSLTIAEGVSQSWADRCVYDQKPDAPGPDCRWQDVHAEDGEFDSDPDEHDAERVPERIAGECEPDHPEPWSIDGARDDLLELLADVITDAEHDHGTNDVCSGNRQHVHQTVPAREQVLHRVGEHVADQRSDDTIVLWFCGFRQRPVGCRRF